VKEKQNIDVYRVRCVKVTLRKLWMVVFSSATF